MSDRCIGLDIGPDHFAAVQLTSEQDRFCAEKVFVARTRRSTDSPRDIVKSLFSSHGFDPHADVAVSIPSQNVFYRNAASAGADRQSDPATAPAPADNDLPFNADDVITQLFTNSPQDSAAAPILVAVQRHAIHNYLNMLAAAGIHPKLVDAKIFALLAAVMANHPEFAGQSAVVAHVDEAYLTLAVARNGRVVTIRKLPIASSNTDSDSPAAERIASLLAHETQITWRKLFNSEAGHDVHLYLSIQSGRTEHTAAALARLLHCQLIIVNPCEAVQYPPDCDHSAVSVAEGLALRLLIPESSNGVNFLGACNADKQAPLNLRKELTTIGLMAAAVIFLALSGLFIRLWTLSNRHNSLQKEINAVFRNTLPDEKNIVNPLAQLQQQLESLQTGPASLSDDAGPMQVLAALTETVPQDANIAVNNVLITDQSIRLTGVSSSFPAVYDWQKQLQQLPAFAAVDVQDVRKQSDGSAVDFTILISRKPEAG